MRCRPGPGLAGPPRSRPAQRTLLPARSTQAQHLAPPALRRGRGPSGRLRGQPWGAPALRCSAGLEPQCWALRSVAALRIAAGGPPTLAKPSPHPCQPGLRCLGPEAADWGRALLMQLLLRARHPPLLLRCRRPTQSRRGSRRRHRQRQRQRLRHQGQRSPKALSHLNSRVLCPKWKQTGRRRWRQMWFTESQRA